VQFVCRYLSWLPNGKVIDKAEFQNLLNQGIAVVLNWEYYADDAIRGSNHYADGQVQAREAERQRIALGAPVCPIYFSADFDATAGQQAAINSYLDGVASVIGRDRVGVYGSYYVIERTLGAGKAKWGWQTYAWSGGNVSSKAHLYQYLNGVMGGQADRNRSLQDNFGQITKAGVANDSNSGGLSFMSDKDNFLALLKDGDVRVALASAVGKTDNVFQSPYHTEKNPYYTLDSLILEIFKRLPAAPTDTPPGAPVAVDPAVVQAAVAEALKQVGPMVQAAVAAAVADVKLQLGKEAA
jgi:hypothetical protein